eukprot:gb/GEZN01011492.1/.p1 GENE.gb/GEZN01011492.1/~~gb/GEZN01011492.1/.p1  ORF type:complete len:279 (-),score=24.66 gb/GEZN01011492.1/:116-952(-)
MDELAIGDVIRVGLGPQDFAPIFFFSHKDEKSVISNVRISVPGLNQVLEMSPGHYLMEGRNRDLLPAGRIRPGDVVWTSKGASQVSAVEFVEKVGLFVPHTGAGTLVVNGVLVSEYTTSFPPALAELFLFPLKILLLGDRNLLRLLGFLSLLEQSSHHSPKLNLGVFAFLQFLAVLGMAHNCDSWIYWLLHGIQHLSAGQFVIEYVFGPRPKVLSQHKCFEMARLLVAVFYMLAMNVNLMCTLTQGKELYLAGFLVYAPQLVVAMFLVTMRCTRAEAS